MKAKPSPKGPTVIETRTYVFPVSSQTAKATNSESVSLALEEVATWFEGTDLATADVVSMSYVDLEANEEENDGAILVTEIALEG